jgi:hypothetical protein
MADADSRLDSGGKCGSPSEKVDFEQGLEQARQCLESLRLDAAVELLRRLEGRYVAAAGLYDLLGDVLIRMNHIEEGVRYKTLYAVLKGTFRIVHEETERSKPIPPEKILAEIADAIPGLPADTRDVSPPPEIRERPHGIAEFDDLAEEAFFPVTVAMGRQLMKQGHFDKALDVFNLLAAKDPADECVRGLRDNARRKCRGKGALDVLRRLLKNVDRMKADLSTGA